MRSILLVDDDPAVLKLLTAFFTREGWEVQRALSGEEGMRAYERDRPDLVLLDLHLPGISGLDVLEVLVSRDATVLLLTGRGDIETAVEAMARGAENFLTKPPELAHLREACARAVEKVELRRAHQLLSEQLGFGKGTEALGSSPAMQKLGEQIRLLAASRDTTVLLTGESGTGKGWVAHLIHSLSDRARNAYVEINCAGLSATFLDSELFGHEKGAFTDAREMKRGMLEVADRGTLLLDEIGDLATELQPKLLKVLESKRFRRLGGTRELEVDVRLIAATNLDLEGAVKEGRFREDLFYRLNVLPLRIPALRERAQEDRLALVQRLIGELWAGRTQAPARLSARALELLMAYRWPGNIRELRNALERALIVSGGAREITPEHLPPEIRGALSGPQLRSGYDLLTLEEVERAHVERTLRALEGNRTRAAEALAISRATLHAKIRKFGLEAVGREG
jgi:two-component system, NtrC family, response regulator AtoC